MALQPLGFVSDPNIPRLTPTYPTGLPLHLMVASWFVGWQFTATVVNIFAALGSGLILWGLARRLQLTAEWAAAALALLWLCPLTLFATLQPMSDLLALFWSLTALWSALRCREHWRWTLLAGLSASLAVLVRPTNALLVLPLALALGADLRRHLLLILSGLPGAVFFCYYNWRAYGSPLTSGYGDVWNAFGPVNLAPNLSHFAWWIPALLTPLVVAALGAPLVRPARQRDLAVLGLWALLLIGFYACYYHSGETWWYLRFILPAFPVLILAALVVLQHGCRQLGPSRRAPLALATLMVFAAVWQIKLTRRLEVLSIIGGEAHYQHAADWARSHLPPESAIFCMQVSGALYFYTPFLLIRWDQTLADRMAELFAVLQQEKRPVYAMLYDFEKSDAFVRMGGRWNQIATVGNTTVWQLEAASTAP